MGERNICSCSNFRVLEMRRMVIINSDGGGVRADGDYESDGGVGTEV